MLSIFFGGGLFLLRWVQRQSPPIPGHTGLEDYLFGMAAAMTRADLWMIFALGGCAVVVLFLAWKELKVFTFDPDFSRSLGLPSHRARHADDGAARGRRRDRDPDGGG